MKYTIENVLENREISKGICRLKIAGSFKGKPGQFYMLRAWETEPLLSRPISIENIEDGYISFLYQVAGQGTKLLSKLNPGNEVKLQGPLGNGFPVDIIEGRVAIITGGIGIAPMKYVSRSLGSNCEVDLYSGFRSNSYLVEELKEFVGGIYTASEDGTSGHKGYVTDIFNPSKYNLVLCCGPEPMMKKVVKMCNAADVPVYVSMEKHMACGIGACLVCTCNTIKGNKRACKDGPVFLGSEVILDA